MGIESTNEEYKLYKFTKRKLYYRIESTTEEYKPVFCVTFSNVVEFCIESTNEEYKRKSYETHPDSVWYRINQ